jgi:hypothetical protein
MAAEDVDVDMGAADDVEADSSSDSDFEMDAGSEQQIMQLEGQLAANPHDYDKHVAVSPTAYCYLLSKSSLTNSLQCQQVACRIH